MIELAIYSSVAVAIVLLAARLICRPSEGRQANAEAAEDQPSLRLLDGDNLWLAERLFDAGDYLWLRDKVCFPDLARRLMRTRQAMALRWLRALRGSFKELVRTLEPVPIKQNDSESGQTLWLVLRFQGLLGYAMLVVRFLGPYHRLVLSLDWLPVVPRPAVKNLVAKKWS